jgi:hypothetical protein
MATIPTRREQIEDGYLPIPQLAPIGTHPGVFLDIQDFFNVTRGKYNDKTLLETVDLTRFTLGLRDDTGTLCLVQTKPMRLSRHPESVLYPLVKNFLGTEVPQDFNCLSLKGQSCWITVTHEVSEKSGKEYAKVAAILPLPAQMQQLAPQPALFDGILAEARDRARGKPALGGGVFRALSPKQPPPLPSPGAAAPFRPHSPPPLPPKALPKEIA